MARLWTCGASGWSPTFCYVATPPSTTRTMQTCLLRSSKVEICLKFGSVFSWRWNFYVLRIFWIKDWEFEHLNNWVEQLRVSQAKKLWSFKFNFWNTSRMQHRKPACCCLAFVLWNLEWSFRIKRQLAKKYILACSKTRYKVTKLGGSAPNTKYKILACCSCNSHSIYFETHADPLLLSWTKFDQGNKMKYFGIRQFDEVCSENKIAESDCKEIAKRQLRYWKETARRLHEDCMKIAWRLHEEFTVTHMDR